MNTFELRSCFVSSKNFRIFLAEIKIYLTFCPITTDFFKIFSRYITNCDILYSRYKKHLHVKSWKISSLISEDYNTVFYEHTSYLQLIYTSESIDRHPHGSDSLHRKFHDDIMTYEPFVFDTNLRQYSREFQFQKTRSLHTFDFHSIPTLFQALLMKFSFDEMNYILVIICTIWPLNVAANAGNHKGEYKFY